MQNYRLLKPGELIKKGDEFEDEPGEWEPTVRYGEFVTRGTHYRRPVEIPNSFDLDFTGYSSKGTDGCTPCLYESSEEWGIGGEPTPMTRENLERARTEARQWLELLENLTPID